MKNKKGIILGFGKQASEKVISEKLEACKDLDEQDREKIISDLREQGFIIPFTSKHFRVIANGILVNIICPNLPYARRLAADSIKNGGEAYIVEAVEMWSDKGSTLEQIPLEEWL